MPTLHLIDADRSQACPAVMSAIRRLMDTGGADDRLLLIGGQPLSDLAQQAGIHHRHRVSAPFSKTYLAKRGVYYWLSTQPGYDLAHCWSVGTLQMAASVLPETPIRLSLIHKPTPGKLTLLKWIIMDQQEARIRVGTWSPALRDQLSAVGIPAEIDPGLTELAQPPDTPGAPGSPPLSKADLRRQWHASDPSRRVVALLSDHPVLADAVDAAWIVCLAGASLADGVPQTITLLIHPQQHNRQRAQNFLADQPIDHRVIQESRVTRPWLILPACDAVLALGRDAGGLSLRWALAGGVPVIASEAGPAGGLGGLSGGLVPDSPLHLAPSGDHKDLAHVLHGVLSSREPAAGGHGA